MSKRVIFKLNDILVTGAAGFIGFHLCAKLLDEGNAVVGLDNMNRYYDPALKEARLELLKKYPRFEFAKVSLEDAEGMESVFRSRRFEVVVNMAAQAGVRYSLENPSAYMKSNLDGFANVLEGCRHNGVARLVYASSSSVYGANRQMPFSESHNVDHPVSLYAATKKANELMAHAYSSLYGLPTTGLRFFTVYGPWGRPDMALFKFTKAMMESKPIDVYNHGNMKRDFTYIDDIVDGVAEIMKITPEPDESWNALNPSPASSYAPYRIYNIGNNRSENLTRMIEILEQCLGVTAEKNMLPMQAGDVRETSADITAINSAVGFSPKTTIDEGIPKFVAWYRKYYSV